MNKAQFSVIKYQMNFTGKDGEQVKFDYIDIEFAPNLFVRFKLTPNNTRVLMRYNPDLYQLLCNIPYGTELKFAELPLNNSNTPQGSVIRDIYTNAENEL